MIQALEMLQVPGKNEFSIETLSNTLERGANPLAIGTHRMINTRVSALALAVKKTEAVRILIEHGAMFDNSVLDSLKHEVSSVSPYPTFSQTIRAMNEKTLEAMALTLSAPLHPKFDHGRFQRELAQECPDRTTFKHPMRALGAILERHLPGFATHFNTLGQQSALQDQTPSSPSAKSSRPRL